MPGMSVISQPPRAGALKRSRQPQRRFTKRPMPLLHNRLSQSQVLALISCLAAILIARVLYLPNQFADYDVYTVIVDNIYYGMGRTFYDVEFGNTMLFSWLRIIVGNTLATVDILNYILTMFYCASIILLARLYRSEWPGIVFAVAVFGPLLAFVTVRATPAYMAMAFAVVLAYRGQWATFALIAVASLFHSSAAIGALPVLVLFLQRRFGLFRWLNRSTPTFLIGGGLLAFVSILFQQQFSDLMLFVISALGISDKYLTYVSSMQTSANASSMIDPISVYDRAYSAIAAAIALSAMLQKNQRSVELRGYVLSSFVIFVALTFSPVAAFRQSIYWLLPVMLVFPWRQSGFRGGVIIAVPLVALAIFLFQLNGVRV